jgi:Cu(I)/Ag(I) efflux system membrane protein CusA/SilA
MPTEPTGPAAADTGLVARLIRASAAHPALVLVLAAVLAWLGWQALLQTPLDAVPDTSDTQVIVFTEWSGRSPDQVEDQLTWPLSQALLSTPGAQTVRGQSAFGMSFVTVLFEDGTDLYDARSHTTEALQRLVGTLPEGARLELGPDASGVGWVYQYALVDRTGGTDLQQLRALQDWTLGPALASVPGVAEVASVGGFVKEFQVRLDPVRMLAHGVTAPQVAQAVRRSHRSAGGQSIEVAGHEQIIRGNGDLENLDDLAAVPVKLGADGRPVLVGDLAEVGIGPAPRRGFAELDGEGEVVGGIVVMRQGADALDTIAGVKARLSELQPGLPAGVEVVTTYDRSDFVHRALDTLQRALLEEMLVVAVVILVFLRRARSAMVAVIVLPIAVLASFIPLLLLGQSANLMSLGGIAVAIGAMVDAAIILVENVHQRLETWDGQGERKTVVVEAMAEVGPSVFFSLLVVTVGFLPVFALQASEGRLFRPLAATKTFAMAAAALLAVTLTPALVVLLVRAPRREGPIRGAWLQEGYTALLRRILGRPWTAVLGALLLMGLTVPAALSLEWEYMPPLNEGSLLFMPTAPPGMGATEAGVAMQHMGRKLKAVPEVERVFGKMGRAETVTDPAPMGMAETTILLKPRSEWRAGLDWDALVAELDAAVQVPGMPNLWWMPIQTRTEMLATGARSPLAVQVFGETTAELEAATRAIADHVRAHHSVRSATPEQSEGGFFVDIDLDRAAAARHGLSAAAVMETVELSIGGMPVTELIEGRARFPVTVRLAPELRDEREDLERVLIPTPSGAQVPLGTVAQVRHSMGPPMLRSEGGQLVGHVFIDPGSTNVAALVEALRPELEQLDLGAVQLAFTGQYRHLERALERLAVVVPLALVAIGVLLWLNTGSARETAIVLLAVPFSLIGAVWLMVLLGHKLSVASIVGLIALAGLDAETAVVMLLYLRIAWTRRQESGTLVSENDLHDAIIEGAAHRLRPKLMTVVTTMLGLTPLLWSTGTGADLMKRIAAPMVGGLVTSFLLELTVYPAIYALWKRPRSVPD